MIGKTHLMFALGLSLALMLFASCRSDDSTGPEPKDPHDVDTSGAIIIDHNCTDLSQVPACYPLVDEAVAFLGGLDILVKDLFLLVGKFLETLEDLVEALAELIAEILQTRLEGVPARMLAKDKLRAQEPDGLRRHYFIGGLVF